MAPTTTAPSSTARSSPSPTSAARAPRTCPRSWRSASGSPTRACCSGSKFNLLNHGNILGRAQTIYGDTGTPSATFGQIVTAGTSANALPALANIDPPRMVQFQVRVLF